MNMSNFDAKGQIVYVDPEWLSGDTCVFTIHNLVDKAMVKAKLAKIRKEFLLRLEQEGFVITFKTEDIGDDVICLTMDQSSIPDDCLTLQAAKREYDRIMFDAGGEKLNYPTTVSVEEYFKKPFYPSVLKNEYENGGTDKFFIENSTHLDVVKQLYSNFSHVPVYKTTFDLCVFQQFIKNPTDYKTYIRILMASSGDILGASLKYSECELKRKEAKGFLESFFWDQNSKYFLDSEPMFNYYSGGGEISFSQPKYSYRSKEILEAHGISGEKPEVPEEVVEVCRSIVEKCNRQLGVICGFDFIFNETDNKWYYLENQAFPAIDEWIVAKGGKKPKPGGLENYVNYCALELETRHEALLLHTLKKDDAKNGGYQYTLNK